MKSRKNVSQKSDQKWTRYCAYSIVGGVLIALISRGYFSESGPSVLGTTTQQSSRFSFAHITSSFSSFFFHSGSQTETKSTLPASQALSDDQLMAMAATTYANGVLPLGDGKYTLNGAKKGYIYLCRLNQHGGGAQSDGPWIHGTTWNKKEKISVMGDNPWNTASFTNTIVGATREVSGNDLPLHHTTGIFPISVSDPAYAYDKNPNEIIGQSLQVRLPLTPIYSNVPSCMGGEVGIMLTGVALFNGFDAGLRDAAAHEVQDECQGHPQNSGEYHYHSLSNCISDVSIHTVIGFALDGFPITGPNVAADTYLVSDNLDECHGITSDIVLDGKRTTSYHYVMTEDFPYSVSCFRGKPVNLHITATAPPQSQDAVDRPPLEKSIPDEAIAACSHMAEGATCNITTPRGKRTGSCRPLPNHHTLACIPTP